MSLSDSISETNAKASDVGEKYLKSSYDYYKLKIFRQLAISVSMVFKAIAIGGLLLIGVVFLGIAIAILLGDVLESYVLGFLIVGVVFLIMALISYFKRKQLMNRAVIKKLSEKFFN